MIDIDPQINDKIVKKPKNNLYATGKRKNSIARVWLIPNGKGEIKVNKKDLNKYFSRPLLNMIIKKHFETINTICTLQTKYNDRYGPTLSNKILTPVVNLTFCDYKNTCIADMSCCIHCINSLKIKQFHLK